MQVMGYTIELREPFIASKVVDGEVGFVNPADGKLYIIGRIAQEQLRSEGDNKMKRVPRCYDIKGLIKQTKKEGHND